MTTFVESRLVFNFGDPWRPVFVWDKHPAYVQGLQRQPSTDAVDFCALLGSAPYLIEVKNIRGHRIRNKGRDFACEVADKVRDTIASLVWALGREHADRELDRFVKGLVQGRCHVVLWLEEDPEPRPPALSALQASIKEELRWLNPHVNVRHRGAPLPDLEVTGQRGG